MGCRKFHGKELNKFCSSRDIEMLKDRNAFIILSGKPIGEISFVNLGVEDIKSL
jgi:hypothetical protein